MKTRPIARAALALSLTLFFSCSAVKEPRTKEIITAYEVDDDGNLSSRVGAISPLDGARTRALFDAGDVIDSMVPVYLECTDGNPLEMVVKVLITPDGGFIVMDTSKIRHFRKDGSFVRGYSGYGKGNEEYTALEDIALDNNGNLLILDAMNRVLFFDTRSGDFLKAVTLNWGEHGFRQDGIIPGPNGGFYILSAKLVQQEVTINPYCLHQFDADGKKIAQGLKVDDLVYTVPFLKHVAQGPGNSYFLNPVDNKNIVWETTGGYDNFTAVSLVDFAELNIPDRFAGKEMDFSDYMASDYYKFPFAFQETDAYATFMYGGPRYESNLYFYSKKSGNGINFNAPNKTTIPVRIAASDGEYFYAIHDKKTADGIDEYADPVTKEIVERFGVIGENENPALIGIKFRFE